MVKRKSMYAYIYVYIYTYIYEIFHIMKDLMNKLLSGAGTAEFSYGKGKGIKLCQPYTL